MNTIDIVVVAGFFAAIVIMAIIIGRLFDRLTALRWALSPGEERAREAELDVRLLRPRFAELETYFGTAIPDELRQLYADTRLILRRDIHLKGPNEDDEHVLLRFLPADARSLDDIWGPRDVGHRETTFPFAQDDFGNYFAVPMSGGEIEECPICYIDREGYEEGRASRIAGSMREFLSWQTDEPA